MFGSGSAGNVAQPNNMQRILIAVSVTMALLGLLLEYLSIFARGWMSNSLDEPELFNEYYFYKGLFCNKRAEVISLGFLWGKHMDKKPPPHIDEHGESCMTNAVIAMLFIGIIHATAGMFLKLAYMIKNDNTQGWMMVIGGILSLFAGVFVLAGVTIYGTNTSEYRGALGDIVEAMKGKGKPTGTLTIRGSEEVIRDVEDIYIIGLGWPFILSIIAGLLFLGDGAVGVAVFAIGQFKR